jgi:flagellar assembly protein FliH
MSARALLFESFDPGGREPPSADVSDDTASDAAREADRLAAYESGYRSGWDDCLASDRDATRRIGAELARNLADLGFTYHEARAQLLAEVEALLDSFFRTVMPRCAGTAVARMLIDDILELASSNLDLPVEIVTSPSDAATVRALVPETTTFPLRLIEEAALAEGQAFVRFGQSERAYDMTGLADRLVEAIAARSDLTGERKQNGG